MPNRLAVPEDLAFQFRNGLGVALSVIRGGGSESSGQFSVDRRLGGSGLEKAIINKPEHLKARRAEYRVCVSIVLEVREHERSVRNTGIGLPALGTLDAIKGSFRFFIHAFPLSIGTNRFNYENTRNRVSGCGWMKTNQPLGPTDSSFVSRLNWTSASIGRLLSHLANWASIKPAAMLSE